MGAALSPRGFVNLPSKIDVLVVGDVILDRYIVGRADRISPEAPVPVLRLTERRTTPGGAANVAANTAALGGRVTLIGVVGNDTGASELVSLLEPFGVQCALVSDPGRPTITKTRLLANSQQMLRLDEEMVQPVDPEIQRAILDAAHDRIDRQAILVISDYAKGTLPDQTVKELISLARDNRVPVLIDPKRPDWSVFAGASLITPNRAELANATGLPCDSDEEAELAASEAGRRTGAAILLTRSERGMSYFRAGARPVHLPTAAREVFDVSGAGDTVISSVALGMAMELPIERVMRNANLAAAIAVSKVGTAVISAEELAAAIQADAHGEDEALSAPTSLDRTARLRERWREQGRKVGLANGCFDLIHPGHVALIEAAASQCDRLIVALNSDSSVKRLKGDDRPIQDQDARAKVMSMIKGVDVVVLFEEDTPESLIHALTPDVLFKGSDYQIHEIAGASHVLANGGRVELIDLVPGQSTSSIVRRSGHTA